MTAERKDSLKKNYLISNMSAYLKNKQRLQTLFDAYNRMIVDPAFEEFTQTDFARILKLHRMTICSWDKRIDWEAVLIERRKHYHIKTAVIDCALFKMAQKDKASAELWYRRFDGYIPLDAQVNLDKEKSDDDLKLEADKLKAKFLGQQTPGPNLPIVGEATA